MITALIARKQKKLQEINYSAEISAASYMYLQNIVDNFLKQFLT